MSDDPRRSSEGKHEFAVIGRPLPKIDAWAKVIGETKYADDLFLPRMAYGRLLRSPTATPSSSASTPRRCARCRACTR